MIENAFKEDLFEGQIASRKVKKFPLKNVVIKHRFLPYVRIPIETVIISAIGVLMFIIIAYAIGVERGKFVRQVVVSTAAKVSVPTVERIKEYARDVAVRDTVEPDTKRAVASAATPATSKITKVTTSPAYKTNYIIQLATFKDFESADRDIKKAEKKGYNVKLLKTGEWYLIYAAGYETLEKAKEAQKKLAEDYKDCYIKRAK